MYLWVQLNAVSKGAKSAVPRTPRAVPTKKSKIKKAVTSRVTYSRNATGFVVGPNTLVHDQRNHSPETIYRHFGIFEKAHRAISKG